MPRIEPLEIEQADPKARAALEGVKKKLGSAPVIMRTMAHSPAVLNAYLSFQQALGGANLDGALREQIALAVAGANACRYCAAAHTALAKANHVAESELSQNLEGRSDDARTGAALRLARRIVEERGWVDDADIQAARDAGFGDAEIAEIVATVAINVFTNYFNHATDPEIDFPEVKLPEAAALK